jgi:hypothetical protein
VLALGWIRLRFSAVQLSIVTCFLCRVDLSLGKAANQKNQIMIRPSFGLRILTSSIIFRGRARRRSGTRRRIDEAQSRSPVHSPSLSVILSRHRPTIARPQHSIPIQLGREPLIPPRRVLTASFHRRSGRPSPSLTFVGTASILRRPVKTVAEFIEALVMGDDGADVGRNFGDDGEAGGIV